MQISSDRVSNSLCLNTILTIVRSNSYCRTLSHSPDLGNHINVQCVQNNYNPSGMHILLHPMDFLPVSEKNGVNTSRKNINCSKLHPFLFMGIFKEHCAFKSLSSTGRVTGHQCTVDGISHQTFKISVQ